MCDAGNGDLRWLCNGQDGYSAALQKCAMSRSLWLAGSLCSYLKKSHFLSRRGVFNARYLNKYLIAGLLWQLQSRSYGADDHATTASSNRLSGTKHAPCCIGADDNLGGYARNGAGPSSCEESPADRIPSILFTSGRRESMSACKPSHDTRIDLSIILGYHRLSQGTGRVTSLLPAISSTKPCHQLPRIPSSYITRRM